MSGAGDRRSVFAWEALDSGGTPTVACEIRLAGARARTRRVPSGASTGAARGARAARRRPRYGGTRRAAAVANVNRPSARRYRGLRRRRPGGASTARCAGRRNGTGSSGGSAQTPCSLYRVAGAVAVAATAGSSRIARCAATAPLLPLPMVNIISGGAHAGAGVDMQDVLVVPVAARRSPRQSNGRGPRARERRARAAATRGLPAGPRGRRGRARSRRLRTNRAALELVVAGDGARRARAGRPMSAIAVDVAATQLDARRPATAWNREGRSSMRRLVDELAGWCASFPVVSLEDPLGEDDWDGWAARAPRALGTCSCSATTASSRPGGWPTALAPRLCQRRAREAEPGRDADARRRASVALPAPPATRPSSRPARANRGQLAGRPRRRLAPVRSRSARRCGPSERPSGTACCKSKRGNRLHATPVPLRCRHEAQRSLYEPNESTVRRRRPLPRRRDGSRPFRRAPAHRRDRGHGRSRGDDRGHQHPTPSSSRRGRLICFRTFPGRGNLRSSGRISRTCTASMHPARSTKR